MKPMVSNQASQSQTPTRVARFNGGVRTMKGRSKQISAQKTRPVRAALAAPGEYAKAVLDESPPFLVLDRDLLVVTANKSFCKSFKIELRQALHRRVYELGKGEWNIPALRTL